MSDSDKSKSASIPAWQKVAPAVDASTEAQNKQQEPKPDPEATIVGKVQLQSTHEDTGSAKTQDESKPATEQEMMGQVRKFLEDPVVRTAPLDKRRTFLESKGIGKEIIDKALEGVKDTIEPLKATTFDATEFKATVRKPSPQRNLPARDVPPVVTYPEFLVQPQNPPPLVTINRLLNTAYLAGGLGAILYGVSKYLVAPMTDNLTEARHEFAQHSESHLQRLNEKLSTIVTSEPSTKPKTLDTADDSDLDSVVSDPTELFHRDTGTQTSPQLSRRASTTSSDSTPPVQRSTIERQEDRLKIMSSHLSEILTGVTANGDSNAKAQESTNELREYLDSLLYFPTGQMDYGAWNSPIGQDKKKDDAVSAFKAEIRGVKGVLLSARRFPGTGISGAGKVGG